MKTLCRLNSIYIHLGKATLHSFYCVFDGDYSHLNKICISPPYRFTNESKENELFDLIYDKKEGFLPIFGCSGIMFNKKLKAFPYPTKDWDYYIEVYNKE